MVEYVEELRPELEVHTLVDLRILAQRAVQVPPSGASICVASKVSGGCLNCAKYRAWLSRDPEVNAIQAIVGDDIVREELRNSRFISLGLLNKEGARPESIQGIETILWRAIGAGDIKGETALRTEYPQKCPVMAQPLRNSAPCTGKCIGEVSHEPLRNVIAGTRVFTLETEGIVLRLPAALSRCTEQIVGIRQEFAPCVRSLVLQAMQRGVLANLHLKCVVVRDCAVSLKLKFAQTWRRIGKRRVLALSTCICVGVIW